MRFALLVLVLALLPGCMSYLGYKAQNIEEWVTQMQSIGASGCVYLRGNSRPYADVSLVYIGTYGQGAPQYIECLKAIPENARSLIVP